MGYALRNDQPQALAYHQAMAEMYDHRTQTLILRAVAKSLTNLRCLEVGAGAGSVAVWLARQVGGGGGVVATDTDPRFIPTTDALTVVEHDVVTDPVDGTHQEALAGGFDLIHARLVLWYPPQRLEVVKKLAAVLNPGGVLLTEDIVTLPGDQVVAVGSAEARDLYGRFQTGVTAVLRGADRTWGRHAHEAMVSAGLVDVRTEAHARTWAGGSAGCRWYLAMSVYLRNELVPAFLTWQELDRVRDFLRWSGFVLHGHPMYSTWGVKPV